MPAPLIVLGAIAGRSLIRKYGGGAIRRSVPILKSSYAYTKNLFNRAGARAKQIYKGKATIVNPAQVATKTVQSPIRTKTGKHKVVKGKRQYGSKTVADIKQTRKNIKETAKIDKQVAVGGTGIYVADAVLSPSEPVPTINQDNVKNNSANTPVVSETVDAKPKTVIIEKNVATDNKNLIKGSGSFVLDTSDKQTIKPYYTGIDPRNQAYNKLQRDVTRPQDVRMIGQKRNLLRNV